MSEDPSKTLTAAAVIRVVCTNCPFRHSDECSINGTVDYEPRTTEGPTYLGTDCPLASVVRRDGTVWSPPAWTGEALLRIRPVPTEHEVWLSSMLRHAIRQPLYSSTRKSRPPD